MYSNVIIFGDSQSDIGNVPCSDILVDVEKTKKQEGQTVDGVINQILSNLSYVPVSNPVNPHNKSFKVPGSDEVFKHPDISSLNSHKYSLPLLNGCNRESASVNWTQYFMNMAYDNGLIKDKDIAPWGWLYDKTENEKRKFDNISINYSWCGAQSNDDCRHVVYFKKPWKIPFDSKENPLSLEDVFNRQKKFRKNPVQIDYLHDLAIPGTCRQIKIFNDDVHNGRVNVNNDTLYIVWTGANDIGNVFNELTEGSLTSLPKRWKNFNKDKLSGKLPELAVNTLNELIKSPTKTKNIIVLSQYNIGMLPMIGNILGKFKLNFKYSRQIIASILSKGAENYNRYLEMKVDELNRQSDFNIVFIDLLPIFNKLSKKGCIFNRKFGRSFMSDNVDKLTKGQGAEISDYLFWDSQHLSSLGQQVIAYQVYNCIKQNKT
ncbi:MAG TPA: SGNH/GDSL hydrolase family protein [Victivallales bacterium]|nr:SGNH/GDSL hydrolase family protein [Victivallales bacterium]